MESDSSFDSELEELYKFTLFGFWQLGDLSYKLKPCQKEMLTRVDGSRGIKYVIKCARRLGKSYFLSTLAISTCIKKDRAMVRFAAPTNKALRKFIIPIMRKILEDCPEPLKPELISSDSVYRFPNGSEIHLAGVNNDNSDSLRGTHADLFIIDEAGFVDDLRYLIDDVALPQFLDPDGTVVANRKLVVSSSPARTPAHEFTEIARECEIEGNYSHFDIYQGGYPAETIELYKKESGGDDSTTWKREYLALDVVDHNYALVPEWSLEFVQDTTPDELFRFWYKYVSLDIGVRDLTVALFAHYDFERATLFVHDEISMNGPEMTTERLALAVLEKEKLLFQDHPIHRRISDIDLLLLNDMRALHGIYFSPTDKGRLEEMVNEVRIWVNAGRIVVNPKCEQLIGCLSFGVWNEKRTDFDRIPKYGHFDALASLMYLVRNVDHRTNPVPPDYGKPKEDYWYEDKFVRVSRRDKLKKAFNLR